MIMFTAHWPPPGTKCLSELMRCVCVSLSTGDITRLSESVSSLHSLSPRWLTAELIPRLTPAVDWRAHVYTQTELTKGWNTYTGWWQRLMHTFYVKRTQAFLEHSNTEVLLIITSGCRHVHTTVTETRKIINLYNVLITIMPYLTDLNHFCHVNHRKALCDMHVYKRTNCCALCKHVVIIISLIPHWSTEQIKQDSTNVWM